MKILQLDEACFGSARAVKKTAEFIESYSGSTLMIITPAIAGAREQLAGLSSVYSAGTPEPAELFNGILHRHIRLLNELFPDGHPIFDEIANTFVEIEWMLEEEPHPDKAFNFDQIVSIGPLAASRLLSAYLTLNNRTSKWLDARSVVQTDNSYRNASADIEKSIRLLEKLKLESGQILVTQEGIGGTSENFTTTFNEKDRSTIVSLLVKSLPVEAYALLKVNSAINSGTAESVRSYLSEQQIPYETCYLDESPDTQP